MVNGGMKSLRGKPRSIMFLGFNSLSSADSLNSQAKEVTNLIGALSESEQRYRILFESAVEGILVTEIKTKKFKYANPALCEILGYTEKEFEQMT